MSSLLSVIARRVPRAAGVMAGSGVGATRARSVRMLSAGPLSGLSRPASGSQPLSALAPGGSTSAPGFTHLQQQQQQCRSLSIQSEDNQESTEELGAAEVEGAAAEAAVDVGGAAQAAAAEEEVGGSATSTSDALYLVQVDGLPFNMPQEEIEQWFADAGCAATSVTVPLWSEKSMRAGQNKGKAYIHLDNEEDTQAVLSLSGRSIGQRWISVSRLAIPLEETRQVAIKGLSGFSSDDVATIFEEAVGAAPVEVNVIENPNRARGLAFVKFETPELARASLALDGSNIHNQWVDVSLNVTKTSSNESRLERMKSPFGPDVPDALVVALKGLPFTLLEDEIRAFLLNNDIGEEDIVATEVPKYNNTQFNTGTAFFHLRTEEAVAVALTLKGTYIGDRWVDVSRWNERGGGHKKADGSSSKNSLAETRERVPAALRQKHPSLPVVAISGLPFNKTQDEVTDFLETNGVPRSAMVEMEMPLFLQTERNTGSCWVVMDDEESYGNLMQLNGAVMDERWLTVNDA